MPPNNPLHLTQAAFRRFKVALAYFGTASYKALRSLS
jgi:hypothetical protein